MLFTFFTFSSSSITEMLGYVGDFIQDIEPLMLPIIAIGLGIFIVWAIIGAFRGR
jgi:type II secretory pathway component PulF